MTDEQCNAIIDAIKRLTDAVLDVATQIEDMPTYYDEGLKKEVHFIARVLEDIKDYKL